VAEVLAACGLYAAEDARYRHLRARTIDAVHARAWRGDQTGTSRTRSASAQSPSPETAPASFGAKAPHSKALETAPASFGAKAPHSNNWLSLTLYAIWRKSEIATVAMTAA